MSPAAGRLVHLARPKSRIFAFPLGVTMTVSERHAAVHHVERVRVGERIGESASQA